MPADIASGLEKDWFRKHSPAAIIAKVTEITLTVISGWTEEYLKYVGWMPNELVSSLYYLNVTTGIWTVKSLGDSSRMVTDQTYIAARLLDSGSKSAAENLKDANAILADVYDAANHCLKVNDVVP